MDVMDASAKRGLSKFMLRYMPLRTHSTLAIFVIVAAAGLISCARVHQPPAGTPSIQEAPALELFGRDLMGNITRTCTIPMDKAVSVTMGDGQFGCLNDDAYTFKVVNAKKSVLAFYDKKCNDDGRFDDDYYKYRFTRSGVNVTESREFSIGGQIGLNKEVVPGMLYFEGYFHNGIVGKLSCVKIEDVQN
jgi:hypothetical protein